MASSIPRRRRPAALAVAALLLLGSALRAGQAPPAPQAPSSGATALQPASGASAAAAAAQPNELFETRVRPLLAANCYACHADAAMAGLRVDSREALLRGGETGPALVPGDPEKSALLKVVQHAEGFPRMPRGRAKLPAADIEAIAQWIRDGAVWPASTTDAAAPAPAVAHERVITPEQRAFWSFQPIRKPAAPAVQNSGLAAHRHRSLRAGAARARRPCAGRRRRQGDPAAPSHAGI